MMMVLMRSSGLGAAPGGLVNWCGNNGVQREIVAVPGLDGALQAGTMVFPVGNRAAFGDRGFDPVVFAQDVQPACS